MRKPSQEKVNMRAEEIFKEADLRASTQKGSNRAVILANLLESARSCLSELIASKEPDLSMGIAKEIAEVELYCEQFRQGGQS